MADELRPSRLSGLALLILGVAASSACLASAPPVPSLDQLGWAVADFDGDSQPDLAVSKMETRSGGVVYWLELDLSTHHKQGSPEAGAGLPAATTSLFGLHLIPRDVDGDHNLDIVVTIGVRRLPVAVWINDGRGRFEEGDLAAYPGLTPAEDISLSAPGPAKVIPVVYDPGRRSRLGLLPGRGPAQPILECGPGSARRPEPLIPRFPCEQAPARAPPSCV